jgi:hypothetical protein
MPTKVRGYFLNGVYGIPTYLNGYLDTYLGMWVFLKWSGYKLIPTPFLRPSALDYPLAELGGKYKLIPTPFLRPKALDYPLG